jgi:hypothetical protein
MRLKTYVLKYENTGYIRLAALVLLVVSLACPNAFALDPMGPTTAGLRQGQAEIGIDYISSTMDVKLTQGKWSESLNGIFNDAGEAVSFELKDFETNKIYANFGYGIWDGCELYLRLGGVNTEFGDSIWEAGEKFEGNTNYSFCLGSRATFYEIGDLQIGRLIQLSWVNIDGDLKVPLPEYPQPDAVDIDLLEVQFAIGATYTAPNGTSIYGGPFVHFVDGGLEDEFTDTSGLTSKYSWDIKETSVFGGYLGTQLYIAENTFLNVEYQRTGGADAFGLSFFCRF